MKNIKDLWTDIALEISPKIKYKWNEAELITAIITYKENVSWILQEKQKDFLLRNCIIGDKIIHNNEIKSIYDKISEINALYKSLWQAYKINIVDHLTDDEGNIYIKNINSKDSFNVYDMIPDSYYLDPNKKEKSKFNEFKEIVKELKLNQIYIISKLFEQLALLHAHNFVVWEIELWDKKVKHPTLSLFLYKLKNKKWNLNEEIFIHDIHNLKLLENPVFSDYIQHCVADIKNLSFDIIRFFKWIWLPQGWFMVYSKILKQINPELYEIMYRSFLRDPRIEIEISAIEKIDSDIKKERKASDQIIKWLQTFKKDKKDIMISLFGKEDIFYFWKSKEKIIDFFESINPKNTEIIIDFDDTLTYPGSSNSLNIWFWTDGKVPENIVFDTKDFLFRMWSISFLKLMIKKWYKIKIYSLWLKIVISKLLADNGIDLKCIEIFANDNLEDIKYDKSKIGLEIDPTKRKFIIGDSLSDFNIWDISKKDLKVWFLNENTRNVDKEKKIWFNGLLDFYFIYPNSNFVALYELLKKLD